MTMPRLTRLTAAFSLLVAVAACQSTSERLLDSDESQLKLRSIQTRAFETSDRDKTLRTVIATLQDLGFVIDKADQALGVVSATKLQGYNLAMSVSVRPRGQTQLAVRANAQYNTAAVNDPLPYQKFFAALEKAMFLTAQDVE